MDFSISAEDAYGNVDPNAIIQLPKSIFQAEDQNADDILQIGNFIPMTDDQGNRMQGLVVSIEGETVTMDFNHPLAEKTLMFQGKILKIREATPEEMKATDKTRWERLPEGQNLNDLEISLDDMANAVKFLSFGFAKNKGKEQGGGAAGGGMPGMASRKLDTMVKLAQNLDLLGMYSVADRILQKIAKFAGFWYNAVVI